MDEYTYVGEPVAFQYPEVVVLDGFPPRTSFSCFGTKKNHCSVSALHNSPASSNKNISFSYQIKKPYQWGGSPLAKVKPLNTLGVGGLGFESHIRHKYKKFAIQKKKKR
ncbi:hypothetical protein HanIR_Chr14g0694031 [Helianthus annuus]|nr:hypothetical protein HanIR_Chr14g0694031 [Helianthus annuus]